MGSVFLLHNGDMELRVGVLSLAALQPEEALAVIDSGMLFRTRP